MAQQAMARQEGVIKFQLTYQPGSALGLPQLHTLNRWRAILYHHRLIGQDPARYGGYGYGNLSCRIPPFDVPPDARRFLISGTQTGHLAALGPEHYALILAAKPEENRIDATGPIRPSSESLTHSAVYAVDPAIHWVFHAHSPAIWQQAAARNLPTTEPDVAYGTPEMAAAVQQLFAETDVAARRIFVMGGHEDGVVAFGPTAASAGQTLLDALYAAT